MQLQQQEQVITSQFEHTLIRAVEPDPDTPKTFCQVIHSSLKHTNVTGNIYFSNYFDWQGAARERWFAECVDSKMLQDKGVFVTKSATNQYFKEGLPLQTIRVALNTCNIKRCSFKILFNFYIDQELVSSGFQEVAFQNHQKRISRIPDSAMKKIRIYEIKE